MRKLIALLFCLLLLCPVIISQSYAEGDKIEISLQISDEARALLAELLSCSQTQAEQIHPIIGALNGVTSLISYDESGLDLAVCSDNDTLFSLSVQRQENNDYLIVSSLLPGYALRIDYGFFAALGNADADLGNLISSWFERVCSEEERRGIYIGDAYSGTIRRVYTFDDALIADLLESIAQWISERASMRAERFINGLSDRLRTINSEVRTQNIYEYELIAVARDNDEQAGYSINVWRYNDLQWSISVGLMDGTLQAVMHIPLESNEVYISGQLKQDSVLINAYQGDEAYTYAEAVAGGTETFAFAYGTADTENGSTGFGSLWRKTGSSNYLLGELILDSKILQNNKRSDAILRLNKSSRGNVPDQFSESPSVNIHLESSNRVIENHMQLDSLVVLDPADILENEDELRTLLFNEFKEIEIKLFRNMSPESIRDYLKNNMPEL